jgi:hypothetical protein
MIPGCLRRRRHCFGRCPGEREPGLASPGIAARNVKGTAAGAQVMKTSRPLPAAESDAFLASLRFSPGVAYAKGTHVAGTIAAAANNLDGITGVAPETKLLPVCAIGLAP